MSLVKAFTHLKDKPRAAEVLTTLQRIASNVKHIMVKHGWTNLPVLAEFFPKNEGLLGTRVSREWPLVRLLHSSL